MKKLILIISVGLFLLSCGDGNSSGEEKQLKNLREEVIERYDGGDKKVVGYYDGEGSNEVIVKRVHYYSQNDGGRKEKEENYKNGQLEGKYYEWYENGNKKKDCNYKNGKLDGKYLYWYSNGKRHTVKNYKNGLTEGEYIWFDDDESIVSHYIYKDGEIIKTIK